MRFYKEIVLLLALAAVIAVPFAMKPKERNNVASAQDVLVVITPHNESIQQAFATAFAKDYQAKTGRTVAIDWRTPGGTTEIAMLLRSEYLSATRLHWTKTLGKPWDRGFDELFSKSKPGEDDKLKPVFTAFQDSSVGIGIDIFFGGGSFDFARAAGSGLLVNADASGQFGLKPLAAAQPALFTDAIIPQEKDGEPYYDKDFRWGGTALSAFGICYNADVLKRLGIDEPPARWSDLAKPAYFGQIALADPTKSGSITKAYEMLIQQEMAEAVKRHQAAGSSEPMDRALAEGWRKGFNLIQLISANGRYFTDAASKIPHDVSVGDAAAGMCIDFYGRTYSEKVKAPDGSSRVVYLTPEGGSSVGVDPVGMFRGAPHPELAHRFLEFVFSMEGQRLWNQRPGTPGGPSGAALRRLPVRRDMYTPEHLALSSDPAARPYETPNLRYEPTWTGSLFEPMRLLIRVACIDNHGQLKETWRAIIKAKMNPAAMEELLKIDEATYEEAKKITSKIKGNKLAEAYLIRDLTLKFKERYLRAKAIALTR